MVQCVSSSQPDSGSPSNLESQQFQPLMTHHEYSDPNKTLLPDNKRNKFRQVNHRYQN